MATNNGNKHNWEKTPPNEDNDDDVDPVDEMIKRTGCLEKHYAVQDCMAEHHDWRKCQMQVMDFKNCIVKSSADFHQRAREGQLVDQTNAK